MYNIVSDVNNSELKPFGQYSFQRMQHIRHLQVENINL